MYVYIIYIYVYTYTPTKMNWAKCLDKYTIAWDNIYICIYRHTYYCLWSWMFARQYFDSIRRCDEGLRLHLVSVDQYINNYTRLKNPEPQMWNDWSPCVGKSHKCYDLCLSIPLSLSPSLSLCICRFIHTSYCSLVTECPRMLSPAPAGW